MSLSPNSRWTRVITWSVVLLIVVLAWRAGSRFPWRDMYATFAHADPARLVLAAVISLAAMSAKGWGWHLLLKPVARHRWWVAQEANLVGSAVIYVSVAVIGEAARVRVINQRDGVPVPAAVASIVWTRAMEGIGLAALILLGGAILPLPSWVRGAELAAVAGLVALGVFVWLRRSGGMPAWVPGPLRKIAVTFGEMGSWKRLPAPAALGFANWVGQWATYHLVLSATGLPITPAASFCALLGANIGGMLRLTPANIGIAQASITMALLPFGIEPAKAVAASVILQALQVLPVLALAVGVVGVKGLGQLREKPALES